VQHRFSDFICYLMNFNMLRELMKAARRAAAWGSLIFWGLYLRGSAAYDGSAVT
jgi:hypothetical protein